MSKSKTIRTVARQHFLSAFMHESNDGRIFTIEFVKKDGSLRKLNGRRGVRQGTNGRGMKYNPIKRGLLPVFDMQKMGWRMVNFDTIVSYTIHGRKVEHLDYNDKQIQEEEL